MSFVFKRKFLLLVILVSACHPLASGMQEMAILPILAFHYELADIHTDFTTTLRSFTAASYGSLGTSLLLHRQVKLL